MVATVVMGDNKPSRYTGCRLVIEAAVWLHRPPYGYTTAVWLHGPVSSYTGRRFSLQALPVHSCLHHTLLVHPTVSAETSLVSALR